MNNFTNILEPKYEGSKEAEGRMSDNSSPGRELEFPRRGDSRKHLSSSKLSQSRYVTQGWSLGPALEFDEQDCACVVFNDNNFLNILGMIYNPLCAILNIEYNPLTKPMNLGS